MVKMIDAGMNVARLNCSQASQKVRFIRNNAFRKTQNTLKIFAKLSNLGQTNTAL